MSSEPSKQPSIVDQIRADEDKLREKTSNLLSKATTAKRGNDDFNPDAPIRVAKAPPKGSQSDVDRMLDGLRGALCAEMNVVYGARAWNDLCGGRALSYAFGGATAGASDLVPPCGRVAAAFCARGTPTANPEGTMGSADAIMNCDMTAWTASCLMGPSGFDADPKDPGYNQRAYGTFPLGCYCACYDQCTMGQSTVLSQRAKAPVARR